MGTSVSSEKILSELSGYNLAMATTELSKRAVTRQELVDLLAERWSPRAFADKAISLSSIEAMLEAAQWAASSRNAQPWRYLLARREDHMAFTKMRSILMPANDLWAQHAAALLLCVVKTFLGDDPHKSNAAAFYDTGAATAQLTMQAMSEGIYVHQMGGFDREACRTTFQLPSGYEPVAVLALGYLGAVNSLPEELQEREQAARSRQPLAEIAFAAAWGQPFVAEDS